MKENQIENKITEIIFDNESILIRGYVIFDAKGLSKKEIVNNQPFIKGVDLVTKEGEEIFIKSDFD